ncbi:MAG: hypothetical protein C0391_03800 [Anaerolinea sp.]|nr:hypothetical protein [Anaerolinea sp.]
MNELTAWKCKAGHVLGQSGRNGHGIRQVIIYREAIDPDELGDAPDVLLVAEGLVMDVRCSICGDMRTWVPGEEAIQRIIKLYSRERMKDAGNASQK